MKEIGFSSINLSAELANGLCRAFTSLDQIQVRADHFDWPEAWNRLVQVGLTSHGPDVSEVGSTWLGSLYAMEALQPLNRGSINALEWEKSFAPAAWKACLISPRNLLVAIPWLLDIRVVLYRRDWLRKVGAEESTAFTGIDPFYETLGKLKAAGHPAPLGLTNVGTGTRPIHDLAGWVWEAGGCFRTEDGRQMLLQDASARRGVEAYFGLSAFLAPDMRGLSESEVEHAFVTGRIAVALLSERTYFNIIKNRLDQVAPEVVENLGMAVLMRNPFIGGTALVVWRHSALMQDGLKLINYLTGLDAAQVLYERANLTPARFDSLLHTSLAGDPFFPVIQQSILAGRSFHGGFRWGAVEQRLLPVIEELWEDLQADPALDIPSEVGRRFSALCERLERTILATYE